MATKQVILKDKDGNILVPETSSVAITDSAKNQSLAETLTDTPDYSAVGIPKFNTVTAYSVGDYVFYETKIYKFTSAHAAGAWDASEVTEASSKELFDSIINNIINGVTVPAYASNLESWASRDSLAIDDTWSGLIQTSGGDVSIDSAGGVKVNSVVAKENFYASALVNTGFNLLRNATQVGTGYYLLVPALEWGSYGTAVKPNGVLFTNSAGQNLAPTVYFKPLSSGVPVSATDGTPITPVESNGYSFYCTTEVGYIIVSGITRATTCMHLAWSRRYDEYISVSDVDDAGFTIDLTSVITAIHSYNQMLVVGDSQDRIDRVSATQVQWTRNNDRVAPTWTTTQNEDSTYTHTATISGMKSGGVAVIGDGTIQPSVNDTTISYTDSNAAATADYVYYQLAAAVTGTATLTMDGNIEDWGLSYLMGATGDAYVNMQYAQSYPDGVAQLLATISQVIVPVISAAFAFMQARVEVLERLITSSANFDLKGLKGVDAEEYTSMGYPVRYFTDGTSATAGAPSSSITPDNWDADTMGVWTGVPQFIGQQYVDVYSKKVYVAAALTGSTGDWVALN